MLRSKSLTVQQFPYRGTRRDKPKHFYACICKRSAGCYRARGYASFNTVIFDDRDEYIDGRLWK